MERWDNTGLLEGVFNKPSLALCLESQRLYNEMLYESATTTNCVATFSRISIPLIRRIFVGGCLTGTTEPCQYKYKFESANMRNFLQIKGMEEEAEELARMAEYMVNELKSTFHGPIYVDHIEYNPNDNSLVINYDILEVLTSTCDVASFSRPIGTDEPRRKRRRRKR